MTVRTIGGVLQQIQVQGESTFDVHQKVRYEYPDRKIVRISPVYD